MNYEKSNTIPIIKSDVFDGIHESDFAVGIVAINDMVVNDYDHEFDGAARLRANEYLRKGYVRPEDLDADGTELDDDDKRSVHFVVLERVAQASLARVIGNMRLVIKTDDTPLPVEKFRPEVFVQGAAPIGSTEASRLICKHENVSLQNYLKWPLFIAGLKYVDEHKLGPVYGLMDPRLTKLLALQHMPMTTLAPEAYIPQINATKQPVHIDTIRLGQFIRQIGDQGIDIDRTKFSHIPINEVITKSEVA